MFSSDLPKLVLLCGLASCDSSEPPAGADSRQPFTQTAPEKVDKAKAPKMKPNELVDRDGASTGIRVSIVKQADGSERAGPDDCVVIEDTLAQYQLGTGEMAPCHTDVEPFALLQVRYRDPSCGGALYLASPFPFEKFAGRMYRAVTEMEEVEGLHVRLNDGRCNPVDGISVARRFEPASASTTTLPNPPYTVRGVEQ